MTTINLDPQTAYARARARAAEASPGTPPAMSPGAAMASPFLERTDPLPVSLGQRLLWAAKASAPAAVAGLMVGSALGFMSGGVVLSPLTTFIGGYAGAAWFGAVGATSGFLHAGELEALQDD